MKKQCHIKINRQRLADVLTPLVAMVLPGLLCVLAFASAHYTPFGNVFPVNWDCYTQYPDYFDWYRRILTQGGSLFYSFGKSLGGEMLGIFAYYLASPLNVLIAGTPEGSTLAFMVVCAIIRVHLAGLCCSIFLKGRFNLSSGMNVAISCAYALCQHVAAWCILGNMWMDAAVLLPLVALGLYQWLCNKKHALFFASTALCIVCCWYSGYMVCLFLLLYFPCEYFSVCKGAVCVRAGAAPGQIGVAPVRTGVACAKTGEVHSEYGGTFQEQTGAARVKTLNAPSKNRSVGFKAFSKAYMRFLGLLSVAVLLSSFVLVPVIFVQSAGETIDFQIVLSRVFKFEFAPGALFMCPKNYYTGAPQIYCGLGVLLGFLLMFFNKRIERREKLCIALLFCFMLACAYIWLGTELWGGLRIPRGYNCRFSFLMVFLMVWAAARCFGALQGIKRWHIVLVSAGIALIAVAGLLLGTFQNPLYCWVSLGLLLLLSLCIYAYTCTLHEASKKSCTIRAVVGVVMVLVAAFELGINFSCVASVIAEGATPARSFAEYRSQESESYHKLLQEDDSWYRLEKTYSRADWKNPPPFSEGLVQGYSQIQHYSSASDAQLCRFLGLMGYGQDGMGWINYKSPLIVSDALLGVKYVLHKDGLRFTNSYALPLGYGVSNQVLCDMPDINTTGMPNYSNEQVTYETSNPFVNQNQVVSAMLGRTVEIYKPLETQCLQQTDAIRQWQVKSVGADFEYAYLNAKLMRGTTLMVGNDCLDSYLEVNSFYAFLIGGNRQDKQGNTLVTLTSDSKETPAFQGERTEILAYYVDMAELSSVIAELREHTMEIQEIGDGYIQASYTVSTDVVGTAGGGADIAASNTTSVAPQDAASQSAALQSAVSQDAAPTNAALQSVAPQDAATTNAALQDAALQDAALQTDSLLFTSVPYSDGWKITVDGQQLQPQRAFGTFIALAINAGNHTIVMEYTPKGLYEGCVVSAVVLVVLCVYSVCRHKTKAKKQAKPENKS